ncbi:Bifunctional nuclease family protein [Desulfovibrionales bacterium]
MVEMKVFGLALDEESQAPVLILKDLEEKTVLPIWIGTMEAMAISLALNGVQLPRPMTHDLLLSVLKACDAKVIAVDVVGFKKGTYFAEIEVEQNGQNKRIDCRPSDGIALALLAEARILVSEEVLCQVTIEQPMKTQPALKIEDAEQWTELLEKLNVDSTKYKM